MNNRRKLVIALGAGALAAPFGSFAQQPSAKFHRIGFLGATSAAGMLYSSFVEYYVAGMTGTVKE